MYDHSPYCNVLRYSIKLCFFHVNYDNVTLSINDSLTMFTLEVYRLDIGILKMMGNNIYFYIASCFDAFGKGHIFIAGL